MRFLRDTFVLKLFSGTSTDDLLALGVKEGPSKQRSAITMVGMLSSNDGSSDRSPTGSLIVTNPSADGIAERVEFGQHISRGPYPVAVARGQDFEDREVR